MGIGIDRWGLMNKAYDGRESQSLSNTFLVHHSFFHEGQYGLQGFLPLLQIVWREQLSDPSSYQQVQEMASGLTRTDLDFPECRLSISHQFNPAEPDEYLFVIAHEGSLPPLEIVFLSQGSGAYGEQVAWNVKVETGRASYQSNCVATFVEWEIVSELGSLDLAYAEDRFSVSSSESGRHLIRFSVSTPLSGSLSIDEHLKKAHESWRARWGNSSIQVSELVHHKLLTRSLYSIFCSYGNRPHCPAPPCGWTCNIWPFTFPQDISYIAPALLRLGHFDIPSAWTEFFYSRIPETVAQTKRIYNADGAMWSWEHPIGPGFSILENGAPNHFGYEIHNAAYPARIAFETACYRRDRAWAEKYAWPVVYQSALFFSSVSQKKGNNWEINVKPSMGQDENGGEDQSNYLCSLYSAEYTLRIALDFALLLGVSDPLLDTWQTILDDGYAYHKLLDDQEGLLKTFESSEPIKLGVQKHPVQLNPLIFVPSIQGKSQEVYTAYKRRFDLVTTKITEKLGFAGWTLPALILAGARLQEWNSFEEDLGLILPSGQVDGELIQFFETCQLTFGPYYTTSGGLYIQALLELLIEENKNPGFLTDSWKGSQGEELRTMPPQPF
jgi:hypothetical protein